jgi:hypothetical protein
MRRMLTAAMLAAAALLAPATMAQAATISQENGAIVYRGEGAEGLSLLVSTYTPWDSDTTYLSLADSGADRQAIVSGPCFMSDGYDPAPLCPLDPAQPLLVHGSAAADDIGIFSDDVPAAKRIEIHGGAGDDELSDAYDSVAHRLFTGGPGDDEIEGYAGNDAIDGGDGSDIVDGGEDDDQVYGGAGDDELWGDHYKSPGADLLDGGPGVDTTQEWSIPENLDRQPAVTVTLDGQANDGRPGEGDNVIGIERLSMYVVGSFTGSDAAEQIKIVNPGNDGSSTLLGRGGDDVLVGNDFDDVVDGGAGTDTVEGGHGNDTVTGGPGRDTIYGDATSAHCGWYSCKIPFGNDVIQARDGEQDTIDCGIGTDRAIVDATDVLANCETVESAAPGGPGPAGPGASSGVAFTIAGKRSVRALAGRGLTLAVRCATACRVTGALHVNRRTARKLKLGRSTKIGGGSGRTTKAGTAKVRIKVAAKAKRRFKRLRKATVTLRVTVKTAGGAKTASRTLKLKR